MEAVINRCKGFLKTIGNEIFGMEFPVGPILRKNIGYDQRQVILEDTSNPGWEPFENGSRFGGRDTHACFRTVFAVTEEYEGREIRLLLRTGVTDIWNTDNPQFLIYVNGEIACGMDMNHHDLCLTKSAVPGEIFDIGIYAYSNSANVTDYLKISFTEKFPEVQKFYYDYKVLLDACMEKKPDDLDRISILKVLDETVNRTYLVKVPSEKFYESVKEADEWLCAETYEKYDGFSDVTVHSIGHTHIDVAWKWPVRQTREKAIRSFSTVLKYMEEYPEYRFMSSTPQLYKFVKEDAPEVFEKIRERVKEGRWETEGSMWVEPDCNLTSGEALVRQILMGKVFFEQEFGTGNNKVLWLPDVFGYSAALPQILRKAGIDYFMTTKINWNETNKSPHDLFMWRGIDGSEVLTYLISTTEHVLYPELSVNPRFETTYNGRQNVTQVMGTWQRFTDKDLTNEVLTCYGFGDGGGGPTLEMLEVDSRLAKGIPGLPVTRQTFVKEFFEGLSDKLAKNGAKLPKWSGELYLEYHRGTYTSQAHNKKNNRRAEFLNAAAETASLWACLCDKERAYPTSELHKNWETTLLNQFHDILPGSSIGEVYEVTDKEYEEILESDRGLIVDAINAISGPEGTNTAVYNLLSFERDALIETPNGPVLVEGIPAMGFKVIDGSTGPLAESSFTYNGAARVLQTPFYQVQFNGQGEISSLYDKQAAREVVKSGEALNRLIAFEDRPWEYDCWNIDSYYADKPMDLEFVDFEPVEDNHERFTVKVRYSFEDSVITQRISFYKNSRRIDFKTHVDWKEQQILLKSAFPFDLVTDKCRADIQFGNVERNTHRNTSWDEAKFEICMHKWIDLSEADYGVALLNDCKYGADVNESTVRITLLKSGIFPDPDADKGEHEFTYSLLPHLGDFREGSVDKEAYKINFPVITAKTALKVQDSDSLIKIDTDGIFVDALKEAEDKRGLILRVHEAFGRRAKVSIDVNRMDIKTVIPCNLLEQEIEEDAVSLADGVITVNIKPYEILTFRLM
ncbi:MAG: alpha-mannosidase [Lachnospiraceae bacterium]|nr:alpha-mannosidase [Lachnospiraceae bacterium]